MSIKHQKDELIILKRFQINENDLLITAYTKFHGKIQLKAKGSKKIHSKFTGKIEPSNILTAEIYENKSNFSLLSAETLYQTLNDYNLQKFNFLQNLIKQACQLVPFQEPNLKLYNLLKTSITSPHHDHQTIFYFTTQFLKLNGTLPNFQHCFQCQEKFTHQAQFHEHHLFCHNCKSTPNILTINLNTLKLLNFFAFNPFRPIQISKHTHQETHLFLQALSQT